MSEPEGYFKEAVDRALKQAAEYLEAKQCGVFTVTRRCSVCGEQEFPLAGAIKDETWLCPECCDKLRNLMGVTEWS